jgi:hypothetical protein
MAVLTLNLGDDILARLTAHAQARGLTVEQLVVPEVEKLVVAPLDETERMARLAALAEWIRIAQERAGRYPPGYVVDDSRESIYEGCGE